MGRFHTLDFIGLPLYVQSGDYDVRIEWGASEYIQFHVPNGSNIFDQVLLVAGAVLTISQSTAGDVEIDTVTTSVSSPSFGSSAKFCHACVAGGSRPGQLRMGACV